MKLNRYQKIGIAGLSMFLFSIIYQTAILPAIVNKVVKKKVALKEGWMMRGIWGKFPFSMEMNFYIFNITNPDKIKIGEKPIVQQVGPFVYDSWQEKTNQVDHEEDDSVSFTFKNTYYFNAEKSNGLTGHEEVIVPSYLILVLLNIILRDKPSAVPIAGKALDSILKKPDSVFIRVKAKDLLFDGLAPIDCSVTDFAGSAICTELSHQYADFGMSLIGENQYILSVWGSKNGTDSPKRTRVHRGLKSTKDVGKVIKYDNKPNMSLWNDDYCDKFNGTDGTIFHPYFNKKGKDPLVAFNGALCRNIDCYFDSKSKVDGVKTLRYTTDLGTDPENNPHHKCYCWNPDKCLKKGAYDGYKCLRMPLIITNPHFYMADPYYLSLVDGLNPVKEKHMVVIDIDPFTGMPMHAHTRAQFNIFIFKLDKFKLMKNFPEALLPLFWFDEHMVLPDFLVKEIKNGHTLHTIGLTVQYLMMFGSLATCGYAGFLYYKMMAQKKTTNKIKKPKNLDNGNEKKLPQTESVKQPPAIPAID